MPLNFTVSRTFLTSRSHRVRDAKRESIRKSYPFWSRARLRLRLRFLLVQPTYQQLLHLVLVAAFSVATPLSAREPLALHRRIDETIEMSHVGSFAAIANDYEFLRRIYLDLVGRTPTSTELREFANNSNEAKRNEVIEKLLSSDAFDQNFVRVLDVMLMERRSGKRVDQQAWLDFLANAVEQKWRFDRIVQEIMLADGKGEQRGAAKWLLAREVEPNALTRDIGRLFFGRDLQCAQCHDHPNITDYYQSEYYGIYAFVSRSYLFEDSADNKKAYVGEKADGDTEFQSVFLPDDGSSPAIPTLLGGLTLDIEPKISSNAYLVEPTKTTAGVPRFSRRTHLARLITHPQNESFARNFVNRIWAHMLGRGLVHPVDFHHADNPPSHPALLKLLADEFVAMEFDYRKLFKEIAISQTYQRSIDFPSFVPSSSVDEQRASLGQRVVGWRRDLEQLIDGTNSDAQLFEGQLKRHRDMLADLDEQIKKTNNKKKVIEDERAKLTKTLAAAKKQLATLQSQWKTLQQAEAAAKKAHDAFPTDKSLASAWKEFEKRVATVSKSVTDKQSAVAKQQTKADERVKLISDYDRELLELQGKRLGSADMVAEARGAVSVFRAQQRREAARQAELESRIAAAEEMAEFLELAKTSKSTQQQVEALAIQIGTAEQQLVSATKHVSQLQSKLTVGNQEVKVKKKELATLQLQREQKQELLDGLELVVENLETSGHLNSETEAAVSVLEEKRTKQANEISTLEDALASTKQKVAEALAKLATLKEIEVKAITELKSSEAALARLKQQHQAAADDTRAIAADLHAAENAIRETWQRRNVVRGLTPLTPEQLAGATITGLGLDVRYRSEATREWEKNQKSQAEKTEKAKGTEAEVVAADEAKKRAEIESLYRKRVDAVVNTYVSMFAAPGGSPQDVFSATADQALFLSNDGRIQNWLSPAEGTLLKRLQSISDASQLAEELYLSILCRPATEEERRELQRHLSQRTKDKSQALRDVTWGLLSSLEFRFNH